MDKAERPVPVLHGTVKDGEWRGYCHLCGEEHRHGVGNSEGAATYGYRGVHCELASRRGENYPQIYQITWDTPAEKESTGNG